MQLAAAQRRHPLPKMPFIVISRGIPEPPMGAALYRKMMPPSQQRAYQDTLRHQPPFVANPAAEQVDLATSEISMSVDGYVAGPEVSAEAPLGSGGERLHDWMFTGKSAGESEQFETEHFSTIGALILGRRMADLGIGPWGEDPTFHAPCFVVTHRPAERIVKKGGTSYIFVTDGIHAALDQAQAAGSQDVLVNGGADIARQIPQRRSDRRDPPAPRAHRARRRRSLFTGVSPDLRLSATEVTNDSLVTHLTYAVEPTESTA